MSFVNRKIDVVLTMATGPFAGVAQTLTGHRVSVSCAVGGGAGMSEANVRIFGMTQPRMNEFSTLGAPPMAFRNNLIEVLAGDESGGMSLIFQGTIIDAYADMMAAPEVSFNITALSGLLQALTKTPTSSFPNGVDAAILLQQLAELAGLSFENNGVHVQLPKRYNHGALRTQIQECIDDAGINGIIENGTLAIWPLGGSRGGAVTPISPDTGMVGYPTYTGVGIIVTTLFNPAIRFGGQVQVNSSFVQACGKWNVGKLTYEIESEVPGGKWFSQMNLVAEGYLVVS